MVVVVCVCYIFSFDLWWTLALELIWNKTESFLLHTWWKRESQCRGEIFGVQRRLCSSTDKPLFNMFIFLKIAMWSKVSCLIRLNQFFFFRFLRVGIGRVFTLHAFCKDVMAKDLSVEVEKPVNSLRTPNKETAVGLFASRVRGTPSLYSKPRTQCYIS